MNNKGQKKISIIVPIRYNVSLSTVCIDSILNYTKNFELILVQEGEDEEITKLLKLYNVKYAHNKEPKGYAGALNTGIELAEGDYYCFLNNDTVVTPNWMENMLKAFDNPEIGLVSPTFTGTSSRQSIEWNDGREFDYIYDSLKLMGVCFLIPKKVIDKVGKWDESFGLGGEEDYDMTIRIANAGYTLCIARKSFIYHYGGASFKELFEGDQEACMEHAKKQFIKLENKHNLNIIPKNYEQSTN